MEIINSFPGYEYKFLDDNRPHNMYRGTDLGFGGYVYAEPGMYTNVALLDIASLHPNSIIAMNYFGEYTQNYADILNARILIKHGKLDEAKKLFGGRLARYLDDPTQAKNLAQALKIALNSCYGLTSASFDNPMRDSRNKNNIVALRGALFMRTLQDEVNERGFKTIHIKTDSIKIPNATPEIIQFCMDFAKKYGYTFEHEATYEKMCLVNDAVYIAKYKDGDWTATGKQFAVPYVFKTLFSNEPITFEDMCETFSVQKGALYLDMNEGLTQTPALQKELDKRKKELKESGARPDNEGGYIVYFDEQFATTTMDELKAAIAKEHDYKFIGRVGKLTPVIEGAGGGVLYRVDGDKYYAAPGSKGYRWLESEVVGILEDNVVDKSFYKNLVDDAVETISKYGDFEWFIADEKE